MDPYRVLGLQPGATEAEVKAAYRRLAKIHHPDHGGSHDRFVELNAAYQAILSGAPAQPESPSPQRPPTLSEWIDSVLREFVRAATQPRPTAARRPHDGHVHEWVWATSVVYGDRYQACRFCGSSRDILEGRGAWNQQPGGAGFGQNGTGL